jgi:DNA polymerase
MPILHRDFETRSALDLKKVGAYVYAMHPSTDVWCMSYSVDDGPVKLWVPGDPVPKEFFDCASQPNWLAMAHNDAFESVIEHYIMSARYGFPIIPLEKHRCTMAMAYAMALPGSLEEAAAALGLSVQKDMAGRRLMLQMSKPRRKEFCEENGWKYTWWDDADRLRRLGEYCIQDTIVEVQLSKRLMTLRPLEQQLWMLDRQINDRGVFVDKDLCNKALQVVEKTQKILNQEMKEITKGAVESCAAVSALVTWLQSKGYAVEAVNKETVTEMLGGWDLMPEVRKALELRQESAKTSTAKVKKMLEMTAEDGRVRGNLQYHGAGTGRWAARGVQLQNLPRPSIDCVTEAIETILTSGSPELINLLYGPPLSVISDCIRGMIKAPDEHQIMAADFSNIEGRGIAWLAGQHDKLDAFRAYDRKQGPDLYLVAAGGIFGIEPGAAKPYRQIGKVAELSLGYQGGPPAFAKMAGNYGLKIGDQFEVIWDAAQRIHQEKAMEGWYKRGNKSGMDQNSWLAAETIKVAWRDANPKIVQYWWDLEQAAINAVKNPGGKFIVGNVAYKMSGSFLWCQLPNGRCLCYPYPRLKEVEVPWGKKDAVVYKCVDGMTRKWQDKAFYGGLAAENITQAIARDLMAEAMLRLNAAGYPPIITIHDEIICEIPKDFGSLEEFSALMCELPEWAKGLPVSAEAWCGERYRK